MKDNCTINLECYITSMRFFLLFLIFAIGFSGFSAAAHAFDNDTCSMMQTETSKKDADTLMNDMADCPMHQKDMGSKKQADTNKAKKSKCLDCIHCCAGHIASLSDLPIKLTSLKPALVSPYLQVLKSDRLFSPLRPPRTIA